MDLNKAYTNFFQKRAGFPKYRKKGLHDSFRFPDPTQVRVMKSINKIKLPKMSNVAYHKSQEIFGSIKNITLSKQGIHWYISIQTRQDIINPIHSSQNIIGIDIGITHFATLSNGNHTRPLNSFKALQAKLIK